MEVQTVLIFIKGNWGNNKEITDKKLSLKSTMFIALTTASRAMEMHDINPILFMGQLSNRYVSE